MWWRRRRQGWKSSANCFSGEKTLSLAKRKVRMALDEPMGDGAVQEGELPGKKVIGALDQDEVVFARKPSNKFFDSGACALFVIGTVHEELWFCAPGQVRKVRVVDRDPEADQVGDSEFSATHTKPHATSKTEASEKHRCARKFCG